MIIKGLFKNAKGESLVEVVVALTILIVAMGGIMSIVLNSKNLLYNAGDYTKANSLAQEGIEIARHQRDIGCSFGLVATSVSGPNTPFVIRNDALSDGSDVTDSTSNDLLLLNPPSPEPSPGTPDKIAGFPGFTRYLYFSNLKDVPAGVMGTDHVFSSNLDDADNINQYYYLSVEISWKNQYSTMETYKVSTIMHK